MSTTNLAGAGSLSGSRRKDHTYTKQSRHSQLSLSLSLFPSPPPRDLGTEGEPERYHHQKRPRGHHRQRQASPPVVSDRGSSLYPNRVYASPVHDWSKSCNDLGLASLSTLDFYPLGIIGSNINNGTGTEPIQAHRSVACLGVYNDNYTTFHHSTLGLSTSTTSSTSERSALVTPERRYRPFQSTLEINSELNGYATGTETDLEHSQRSSYTDYSYYLEPLKDADNGSSHLKDAQANQSPRIKKWYKSFGKLKGLKVIKKINKMSSSTPAVPPRSALRTLPTPITETRPEVMERESSLYTLTMGPPLAKTPSLSSGSDGDVFDDATAHLPVNTSFSKREKERGFFGKKEVASERDPLRIRDGREAKESPTGVYTPLTFPGACGPRPSHFPSHVYTPPTFNLYPTPSTSNVSSAGPSRSNSLSSSEVNMPQTPVSPVSPTLRVFGNKTMAGLRRLSGQIAAYSPSQASNSRDSYFSYSSTTSRQSSMGPITPNSVHFPAGLGVGLTENDGITTSNSGSTPTGMRSRTMSTIGGEDGTSPAMKRPIEAPKGKRKPVPEIVQPESSDDDAELNERMSQAHIGVTHAL